MLAERARARLPAERRNGHPAQNWTGVARAAEAYRAQAACGQATERTRTARARGHATISLRPAAFLVL